MAPHDKSKEDGNAATAAAASRRIIYVSLEYCHDDLFSGNGIVARSHVRGLSAFFSSSWDEKELSKNNINNSNSHLFQEVIVARPMTTSSADFHLSDCPPGVRVHVVPVSGNWKTTDRAFDHETFAKGVERIITSLLLLQEEETQQEEGPSSSLPLPPISAILAVDWTGMAGVQRAQQVLVANTTTTNIPVFFLNFRVYARMTNISDEDRAFYQTVEADSVRFAMASGGAVMALCSSDKESLQELLSRRVVVVMMPTTTTTVPDDFQCTTHSVERQTIRTIWPMLRQEFHELARRDQDKILNGGNTHKKQQQQQQQHRPYFACIVRLSKDKGPQRFLQVCQDITKCDPKFWIRTNTIPLLAGAASQPDFAESVKADLQAIVPNALILDTFLNPEELADLLQQTRLNLHPALYEAWGMTIVEAAACGVPTLLNHNGAIGAEQLLPIHANCSLGVDMESRDAVAARVMELLLERDSETLSLVGQQAYKAAIRWTEEAHVRALWEMVEEHTLLSEGETASPLPN